MKLIAVDAGVHGLGVAGADTDTGKLTFAEYLPIVGPEPETWASGPARLAKLVEARVGESLEFFIVEQMMYYGEFAGASRGTIGSAEDLLRVQAIVGGCAALIGNLFGAQVIAPRARDWKGQVPKQVHNQRTQNRVMTLGCRDKVTLPRQEGLGHNVWDAVGLALWGLTCREVRSARANS